MTLETLSTTSSLIDPEIPIEPGAQAIHGITAEMVAEEPTIEEFVEVIMGGRIEEPCTLIAHNCVTGDHEVLTLAGWRRFDSLAGASVEAAVWDPETSAVHFESCPVVRNAYEGPLLAWQSSRHCGVYTPDHRMYMKTSANLSGSWRVLLSAEAAQRGPNSLHIPCSGRYEPRAPLSLSALEARILEMVRADGSIGVKSGSPRLKFKKGRKIARCRALLDAAGVPYREYVDGVGVTCICTYQHSLMTTIAELLGRGKEKQLGPWALSLTYAAREALLDEAAFWDGRADARERGAELITVHSAKSSDAEWLATLAVVTGRFASVSLDQPNTRGLSSPTSVLSRVSYRKKEHVKTLEHPETLEYSGAVYCLSTSKGAFLVRRNGCTWVTGNCRFDKPFFEPVMNVQETFCSLSLCRHMYPSETENHRLGTMKDFLKLEGGPAHRALGDIMTVHQMLQVMLPLTGKTLLDHLQTPARTIYTMPWGEHKGKALADVPRDYRAYLLSLGDLEEDLRRSLKQLWIAGM